MRLRFTSVSEVSHHTLIHVLVRPAVRIAARSGITPNQVTTLRLLTALSAAGLFATGGSVYISIGAGVFLLSVLLDRVDGELARQTGRSSDAGHRYDLVSDCTANVTTLIGLGFGQVHTLGWAGAIAGLLAGTGVGVLFWALNVLRDAPVTGLCIGKSKLVVDPDDAMVLLPVLIWLGAAPLVLLFAAVATPLGALTVLIVSLRGRAPATGRAETATPQAQA